MHKLKILNTKFINQNVKRFTLEKPKDLVYRPGQSAHVSINLPEWKDKIRKFSFTSLNAWPQVEFTIKIYDDRKGVTHQLGQLKSGDELLIHDVFGTIEYKGPGIFIAGGTGITPFIAIFRALYHSGNLRKVGLIYSNRTQKDIIYGNELAQMLGSAYINVFTRQGVIGFMERRIDKNFLIETIQNFDRHFYVCGPKDFTHHIKDDLISLGAKPEFLVI